MPAPLIRRQAVRAYVLERVRVQRPGWDCTRVSEAALDMIDARLRREIEKLVHAHPCGCGKTFRP